MSFALVISAGGRKIGIIHDVFQDFPRIHDHGSLADRDAGCPGPAGIIVINRWHVNFNATGPLGGSVEEKPLVTTVRTDKQYAASP